MHTERWGLIFAVAVWFHGAAANADAPAPTLIINARVVDGTGAPARAGSVRVKDGRIEGIGDLKADAGETVVDARGLVLSPGFIDTHRHHEGGLAEHPDAAPGRVTSSAARTDAP